MASSPILIFSLLCFFSLLPAAVPDDRSALLLLRSSLGRSSPSLSSWNPATNPCSWPRIACNSGRVTEIHLPGAGLIGQIPPGILGNLTSLRLLSLRLNLLSGPLPSDLAAASQLRHLYLHGNNFSGPIPDALFKLNNLLRINLSKNQFSGSISSSFNNLTRLATLYLESNRLTGDIPNLNLPGLKLFNVSYNALNGSILGKLQSMPASAFLGTSLCGGPLAPCPGENTVPATTPPSKVSGGVIAGISVGVALLLLILLIIFLVMCHRMRRLRKTSSSAEKPVEAEVALATPVVGKTAVGQKRDLVFFDKGARGYDLEGLLGASAEVLGQGTVGIVYKAVTENGLAVAVKRLKGMGLSEKEFREKMKVLGEMRHPNLVSLQAYFYSRDDKLLIYEYMPRGSLSSLLHGSRGPSRPPLNWEARTNIALAVARGLVYIHSRNPTSSHGNIRSSNILLSGSHDIHVSDHGLAELAPSTPTRNRAFGYHAPEVTDGRKVSQKADVYSFGVLLLELLTGKAPSQAVLNLEGIDLPRWVKSVVQEEWTAEVFDLELMRYTHLEEEMVSMLRLAVECVEMYPDRRPGMAEVMSRIEEIHRSSLASAEGVGKVQFDEDEDDQSSPLTRL